MKYITQNAGLIKTLESKNEIAFRIIRINGITVSFYPFFQFLKMLYGIKNAACMHAAKMRLWDQYIEGTNTEQVKHDWCHTQIG